MFKPKRSSTWRPTKGGGSYWRHVEDGDGVTVFYNEFDDSWKWVYQGDYSEKYEAADEAMAAANEALDLDT